MDKAATGVLIIAAQRELRRELFDLFDHEELHPAVYSARDLAHARQLLQEQPKLDLAVLVCDGDAQHTRQNVQTLRQWPSCSATPLLLILTESSGLKPSELPAEAADWLYASQIGSELIGRWRRLAHLAAPAVTLPAAIAAAGDRGDYRFAFDEADTEWVVVDPVRERIIESSVAMIRLSGLPLARLSRLPIAELFQFEQADIHRLIAEGSRQWHRCKRLSATGSDDGQASARRIRHQGRDAVAFSFRSDHPGARAESALELLTRLFNSGGGDDGVEAAAKLLYDALELDYFALWSARPEDSGAPTQLLQLWRGENQTWPSPGLQSSLRLVLYGQPMLHQGDAGRLAEADPLLEQLGLNGFAGLPLLDERRNVLGALLVGTHRPFGNMDILGPTLRVAATRFAHALELKRTREQGRAEGLLDALTGLPNRLLFNDRLDMIIREATRTGECFALLFVDLDRFKTINDTLGHAVGDQVLITATQRLRTSVRASDTVARYAGDEFVVVLIAEKIVQLMQAPLRIDDGTELQVTASIGVSFHPDDADDAETLLKHADEAMYAAKSLGRNNFQIYEVSAEQAQQQNLALKSRLRHAENNGELRVFFQPQVDAKTEDIVGMEALVRWEHPELGYIGPGFFIPLAEETGLIVSIGEWVLRAACRQAEEWERKFGLRLRLGVNLSAVQLMQPNLLEVVSTVLQETGLDPNLLEMEITESISIKAAPNLMENLHGLHKLGCRIAIDDFGTGAASLDYLRKLPADRIKIDQSFVRNIGVDPDDEAIVRTTIEMAHRLKRGVVAEGVEIEQHLQFLRANHCDELQGYLFCRPLPVPTFEKLLSERQRLIATAGE
jgi:diguanylate cyclase (GGDEF)-like protein